LALGVVCVPGDGEQRGPVWTALSQWRDRVARTLGAPAYTVVTDATLRALAGADPFAPDPLSRIPGLGPRARKNYGDELLRLLRVSSPPSPPAS
jgi:ribonuclease D